MVGKSHFYKIVLFLVKTIIHKFWAWKNYFERFYVKLTIVWGGWGGDKTGCSIIKKLQNRRLVCLCWSGYYTQSIHRRKPIATRHGLFELLCFHPHPFQVSLINLDTSCSHVVPISMPSSMRTPVQREIMSNSDPDFKPSSISSLPVTWITEPATDPSWNLETELKNWF